MKLCYALVVTTGDGTWERRIRDPLHGLVVFGGSNDTERNETDTIAWKLIDTEEFQRLRRIRQLGFSDFVYLGATHSRLAHSIGVYHIARRLVDVIRLRLGTKYDPDRARIALLAALLHDIGHGPFSHAFETVAEQFNRGKRHEEWSAEIVQDDQTEVHCKLREVDEALPGKVSALLKEEPTDIYATIVSSQFDADRLDYIQRDRLMTGVESGHVDFDWLLDCLEVGSVTIARDEVDRFSCFYLGPKGLSVAEEYLEARFRLYRMVYMHKTTRAVEKMLEEVLNHAVSDMCESDLATREPLLRYLVSEPSLKAYLDLDDATVWAALAAYAEHGTPRVADLAKRIRRRQLYKCVDVGSRDPPNGNLYLRVRGRLDDSKEKWTEDLLYDTTQITPYRWYDFDDPSALAKVLVKKHPNANEPTDIAAESSVVRALQEMERIQRIYAPDGNQAKILKDIVEEVA